MNVGQQTLEEALIHRYGTLGRARDPITLRSENGLVFTSRHSEGVPVQTETGVHTTPYPAAEWHGRATDSDCERAVYLASYSAGSLHVYTSVAV